MICTQCVSLCSCFYYDILHSFALGWHSNCDLYWQIDSLLFTVFGRIPKLKISLNLLYLRHIHFTRWLRCFACHVQWSLLSVQKVLLLSNYGSFDIERVYFRGETGRNLLFHQPVTAAVTNMAIDFAIANNFVLNVYFDQVCSFKLFFFRLLGNLFYTFARKFSLTAKMLVISNSLAATKSLHRVHMIAFPMNMNNFGWYPISCSFGALWILFFIFTVTLQSLKFWFWSRKLDSRLLISFYASH